jgi:hypothetical protein
VCVTRSRSFSDELSAVYGDIHTYRNQGDSGYKQAEKGKYRKLVGIAMVGFFYLLALYTVHCVLCRLKHWRNHRDYPASSTIACAANLFTGCWSNLTSI